MSGLQKWCQIKKKNNQADMKYRPVYRSGRFGNVIFGPFKYKDALGQSDRRGNGTRVQSASE